jgi:hypothetical protein
MVISLSASWLPGVSTTVFEPHNFQGGIFYDKSDLFAERHLFPEIVSDSPCTRAIICAHQILPFYLILLYY